MDSTSILQLWAKDPIYGQYFGPYQNPLKRNHALLPYKVVLKVAHVFFNNLNFLLPQSLLVITITTPTTATVSC